MKTVLKKLRVFRMPLLLIIILVLLWFPLAAGKGISIINGDYFLKHNWAKLANAAAFIIGLPVAVYVIFRITGAIKLNISLKSLIPNTKKYLPDVSESLLSDVENDISGGMRFLKKGHIGMSENYIIGSLTLKRFTPVIIPVSEVVEVLYESFEGEITHLGIDKRRGRYGKLAPGSPRGGDRDGRPQQARHEERAHVKGQDTLIYQRKREDHCQIVGFNAHYRASSIRRLCELRKVILRSAGPPHRNCSL